MSLLEERTSSKKKQRARNGSGERAERMDTVVVGGGQSGLAMSYLLTEQDREHVVLDKANEVGASWRKRWDSFTLVTPNWQLKLPGHAYDGDDPDGFLSREEVVAYLEDYVDLFDPPLRLGVEVTAVARNDEGEGYLVHTDEGTYEADNVVVAAGTFQRPRIPAFSARAPQAIAQLHSSEYRNPQALPEGAVLVVGSGQSGSQIAQELHGAGRRVYLCTGSAGRLPRRYRGKDGMWWVVKLGLADETVDQLDSPAERFEANPQVSGKDGGQDINLHTFAREGMTLLGRLQDIRDGKAFLADDLHDNLAAADEMAAQIRKGVDNLVRETGMDAPQETVSEPRDGYEQEIIRQLDLQRAGIGVILWATGYERDYSWVQLPIFDAYGYPVQERGVTEYPGLYFLGLHWLHTLKSGLFWGVGKDARHVAEHVAERMTESR